MKLKNLFVTLGLTLAVGIGIAVGVGGKGVKEVKADPAPTTYYLTGDEWSWATDKNNLTVSVTDGAAPQAVNLTATKSYKFVLGEQDVWAGSLGYANTTGTAIGYYVSGSDNFTCNETGTYYIKIANGVIHINQEESTTYGKIYVQLQDWENTCVYAFDESVEGKKVESLRAWPGTKVTDCTAGINFQGSEGGIGVLEIPYTGNKANTKLIISNNGADESAAAYLNLNHYYYKNGTPREAMGARAKVVYDINKAAEAADSICDIDESEITALLAEYDALNESNQGYVNSTTYYTHTDAGRTSKSNFTFDKIIAQMRAIVASGSPSRGLLSSENHSNIAILVVVISSVALVSVGGFFLLKKKREN